MPKRHLPKHPQGMIVFFAWLDMAVLQPIFDIGSLRVVSQGLVVGIWQSKQRGPSGLKLILGHAVPDGRVAKS